jgi:redox-sensitive bicupin YhaK (pirin superfamily)
LKSFLEENMQTQIRRSDERGYAEHGWLKSFHTFSFANYYDSSFMGFRDLRVINEDFIEGGNGFPTHPHNDMEIITYVISGELAHQDTLGNATSIRPLEVQRMSAGTGVRHSEFNPLASTECHLLQIWIMPEKRGIEPSYAQKSFAQQLNSGELTLVVSRDGRDGSLTMNQNVDLYAAKWGSSREEDFELPAHRYAWLQLIEGELSLADQALRAGDALAISSSEKMKLLKLRATGPAHFLLFVLN